MKKQQVDFKKLKQCRKFQLNRNGQSRLSYLLIIRRKTTEPRGPHEHMAAGISSVGLKEKIK